MRDGPEGERIVSRLQPVMTSCIVLPAQAEAEPQPEDWLSDNHTLALQALSNCTGPNGFVRWETWLEEMHRIDVVARNYSNLRQFKSRLLRKLVTLHKIEVRPDDHMRLVA
jgi:hypothetical protein